MPPPSRSALVTGSFRWPWIRAPEARTIRLLGDRFWHVDLLVIPPDTAADAARAALALVAVGDGRRRVAGPFRGAGGFIMRPVISFVVFLGSSGER